MRDINFKLDDSLRVIATDSGTSASIESQSVEALLMLAMLEKLEEIRCCTIDVEDAINPR